MVSFKIFYNSHEKINYTYTLLNEFISRNCFLFTFFELQRIYSKIKSLTKKVDNGFWWDICPSLIDT